MGNIAKAAALGAAAGLAWIMTASAQQAATAPKPGPHVVVNPDWEQKPTGANMSQVWPIEALKQRIPGGRAVIKCSVGADGRLTDCAVQEEQPQGAGFGQAALKLSSEFRMKPKTIDGQPVAGAEVTIPINFQIATGADSGQTYTAPDWLQKPSLAQMYFVWPRSAAAKGSAGRGVLKCVVNKQGLAQACEVISESPAGKGFGEAALKLTPTFLFKPAMLNGEPVDAEIAIPITFEADGAFDLPNAVVVDQPAWARAPAAAEVMAQLDKKVGDKFADGKVVFMCDLNKTTGKVSYCIVANASPGMAQFADVGKALAERFQADETSLAGLRRWLDPTRTEALVFVPFSFPDMASPGFGARYVTHVQWVRALSPTPERPLFPEEAAKAGLKEGSAMVDCQIGADGRVSQCRVLSESTAGMGFGAMATTIAEGAVANRWTEEGLPVEGARVKLPITMTAAAASAPKP
jgi:TonB family protein